MIFQSPSVSLVACRRLTMSVQTNCNLVRYSQLLAAMFAARCQYSTTISGLHSLTESVFVLSLLDGRLKCSFHLIMYFSFLFRSFELQSYFFFVIKQIVDNFFDF